MVMRMVASRSGVESRSPQAAWGGSKWRRMLGLLGTLGTLTMLAAAGAGLGCGGGSYHPTPLQPAVCSGIDLQPASTALDEMSLINFLKAQGVPTRIERARADLVYVEVQLNAQKWVRLRVAVLGSPMLAGRELHDAMLQHKEGSWGVHRSNLAVLGPVEKIDDTIAFAQKTKLACWGVLTIAASADEAVVVPGGYREL